MNKESEIQLRVMITALGNLQGRAKENQLIAIVAYLDGALTNSKAE